MPVYNEEACIDKVMGEWLSVIRQALRESESFEFIVINDGSTDTTLQKLNEISSTVRELKIIDQKNQGHGLSCLAGYRRALEGGANWVLQIDSDGQCDPKYLPSFWKDRMVHPLQMGWRKTRDDGFFRLLASRIVSLLASLAGGQYLKDANVPYRLIRSDLLEKSMNDFLYTAYLPNVFLTIYLGQTDRVCWRPMHFRKRYAGVSSVRFTFFIRYFVSLVRFLLGKKR